MNPHLPDDARAFAEAARGAFDALGGIAAARRVEAEPARRDDFARTLDALGVADLDPRTDPDVAAAAAALCEQAGRVVLPVPLPALLVRDRGIPLAVVPADGVRVDHGDWFPRWDVVTLDGRSGTAHTRSAALGSRLGPFVCDLVPDGELAPPTEASVGSGELRRDWWLVLSAWTVLGALDRALELAVSHTSGRTQFGKPLTAFQAVRFQLADIAVAVSGLRELAGFTLWRLASGADGTWPDVLALRSCALDTAREVLRTAQQLHGATGLCDEADISIIVRHLQPALRLPDGPDDVARRLAGAISRAGFDGLFSHGGVA